MTEPDQSCSSPTLLALPLRTLLFVLLADLLSLTKVLVDTSGVLDSENCRDVRQYSILLFEQERNSFDIFECPDGSFQQPEVVAVTHYSPFLGGLSCALCSLGVIVKLEMFSTEWKVHLPYSDNTSGSLMTDNMPEPMPTLWICLNWQPEEVTLLGRSLRYK
jgi:hypothetical protein